MFKKMAITVIMIGVIALSGCSLFTSSTPAEEQIPTPTEVVVNANPIDYDPLNPNQGSYDSGFPLNAPMTEHWLSPATINVTNYWAGYTAKFTIRVHNGNSYPTIFSILYTQPDSLDVGYSAPTLSASNWINVSSQFPIIPAYTTQDIVVTLAMPEGTIPPAKQWMFWVCAKDASQDTMVQTRLCMKFKITME
jgi:hypothetical protein